MSDAGSKAYNPREVEPRISSRWVAADAFRAVPDDRPADRRFVMVIPPPNVTGALHLGHALNNTLQDILVRQKRMAGFNTLWLPGTDHAGIATQAVVEKEILKTEKKNRHDLGRDELVRRIWEWKEKFGGRIVEQLRLMGCSCDWSRLRFTLDEQCAGAVREFFFRLFKAGLVYRGKRLVNWDTQLQTAVADDEVYHETVKGHLWHVRYPLAEPAGDLRHLVVATTRPETMLADTAVAVHPDDPRYAKLIGRRVKLPLTQREIPIIGDGLLVKREFGTGCVKVTPGHDANDNACWQRHPEIGVIDMMTPDGRVIDDARWAKYAGLKLDEARKRVVADLEAAGLLEKVEDYETDAPHSDRSKSRIESLRSDQWFVKMGDLPADEAAKIPELRGAPGLAQMAIDAVNEGRVRFSPARYVQTYVDWLREKRDWCISRQLWWGHRIPIWAKSWPMQHAFGSTGHTDSLAGLSIPDRMRAWGEDRRPEANRVDFQLCLAREPSAADRAILAGAGFEQDPDVLDTWFSSALWPLSTLGWPETDTKSLNFYYPTTTLSTAREIITLWVARMVIAGLFNVGAVPFRDVVIHAVIQDGQGRKMSKTLGNGVDPVDIIDAYGADALRFTLAELATETQDIRIPVKPLKLPDGRQVNTSDRFEKGRNFVNKLWQVSTGFVIANLDGAAPRPLERAALPLEDRWILSRLTDCGAAVEAALAGYRFSDYAQALYAFLWNDYCDWYVEMVKGRLRGGGELAALARQVLVFCLDRVLRMLHPVAPFVTEAAWEALGAAAPRRGVTQLFDAEPLLCRAAWPAELGEWRNEAVQSDMDILRTIIRGVRDIRTRVNALRPGQPALRTLPRVVVRGGTRCCELLAAQQAFVRLLAGCDGLEFATDARKPAGSMTLVHESAQVYVPVGELVDLAAERRRLEAELSDRAGAMQREAERLSNESFVSRAAPEVVERSRARVAELESQVQELRRHLADVS